MNTQTQEALKKAIEEIEKWIDHAYGHSPEECADNKAIRACKEALEQEERTQRTMHCGTADAFIAMDDDHKRRWFVQSLRESKRRKELEDILEQPAQEPVAWETRGGVSEEQMQSRADRTKQEPVAYMYKDQPNSILILYPPQEIPKNATPLYPHPASSWQRLSDDEILSLNPHGYSVVMLDYEFARAIEQALKEKNT